MTTQLTIRSIGAGGDGVANLPDGQIYVPFTLPGEVANVARDKNRATLMALLEASPERQDPACQHFEACGGCALQHWQDEPYRLWKRELVVAALKGRGIDVEVEPLVACAPHTRRRAVFAVRKTEKGVLLGFNRHLSHEIIDIVECPVTVPEIMIGSLAPISSNTVAMPNSAALAFSVSKTVSTINTSLPPSINPRAASA